MLMTYKLFSTPKCQGMYIKPYLKWHNLCMYWKMNRTVFKLKAWIFCVKHIGSRTQTAKTRCDNSQLKQASASALKWLSIHYTGAILFFARSVCAGKLCSSLRYSIWANHIPAAIHIDWLIPYRVLRYDWCLVSRGACHMTTACVERLLVLLATCIYIHSLHFHFPLPFFIHVSASCSCSHVAMQTRLMLFAPQPVWWYHIHFPPSRALLLPSSAHIMASTLLSFEGNNSSFQLGHNSGSIGSITIENHLPLGKVFESRLALCWRTFFRRATWITTKAVICRFFSPWPGFYRKLFYCFWIASHGYCHALCEP